MRGQGHIHTRTQKREAVGHEFWDADGKTIWYDLQVSKGKSFFLASYNTETKERRRYQMDNSQWSIHFNGDLNSGIFCGDGGGPFQVASAPDGQWIELYHPLLNSSSSGSDKSSYLPGIMQSEHLVDLSKHDYKIEPNVRFSPDHKQVIFTSNIFGPNYVFSVDVDAAKGSGIITSSTHRFAPSATEAVPDTSATIQVVDHSGAPLENALVLIKSLDKGHQIGVYSTGQDGKIPAQDFDQGMYRISITCTNGACGNTHKEMFAEQLTGNVVIHAKARASSITSTALNAVAPSEQKTTIIVQDANHKALADIQFLVRTTDIAQETWFKTNKDGSANVNLPADPSVAVFLIKRVPHTYKLASECSTSSDVSSDVLDCIQVGDSTVITLPQ